MIDQSFWYFEDFDLYEILCPMKDEDMASMGLKITTYEKGSNVYIQEEDADKIFFISHGRIKISMQSDDGKEIIKTILEKGEVFGELAMLGQKKRADFATTLEDSEICIISLEDLKMITKTNSSFQVYIMSILGKRAITLEKRLEALVFKNSRTRIVEYLIELVETKGQRVGYEQVVRKFNTHKEIAGLTATSRQTVTKILNELRNKNILTFDRKRLLVRDMNQLQKEAAVEA